MKNRIVVGASYGLKEWLFQRMTAVVMLAYTLMLFIFLLNIPSGYEQWQAFFKNTWVQIFSQLTFTALLYHVWIGIRDVWMDYIKPNYLRLIAHSLSVIWILGCFIYSARVIWL